MIRLDEKALKGSFPPLVTPFKEDGSVDYDTYGKLVEFHVKGGSPGIVVTGTTGEPSVLTPAECVPFEVENRRRFGKETKAERRKRELEQFEKGWEL